MSRIDKVDRKKIKIKRAGFKTAADLLVENYKGRPIIYEWYQDDLNKMEKMATIGMTNEQIAKVMGMSLPNFSSRIAAHKANHEKGIKGPNIYHILENARALGDGKILRTMYQVATEDRHPTMLIWLSKVRLGLREEIDVNSTHKHTFVYESQLSDGIIRQESKQLDDGKTIDVMINEVTEELCPKPESESE